MDSWGAFKRKSIVVLFAATIGCSFGGDADRVELLWGDRGQMPGQFVKPRAIAIDDDGRLYIVDMRAQIQVFTRDGEYLTGWQTPTHEFGRPSGLAIDSVGNLLVADSHYHRILVYRRDGQLTRTIGGDADAGSLTGRFGYIGDVAVDSAGNVYVAESQLRERITKLSPNGDVLKEWGGRGSEPGQFQRIRSLTFDAQDRLYVADACNHRIQVFDADGILLRVVGEPGSGPGQLSYPFDVTVDHDGSIIVCEYGNHRLQRFAADGRSMAIWGRSGRNRGELWNPWAVAIDHQKAVHVVDSNNHRVQRLRF